MSTQALLGVILPVFGLIGIGYFVVAVGLVGDRIGDALAEFVFTVSLPLLLFRTLGTAGWPDVSPWPFWLTYFTGVAIVWFLATVIVRKIFGRDARSGVVAGISAGYSNLVLLGIPVINQAFGQDGLVIILMLVSIHLAVMMTASAIHTEVAAQRDGLNDAALDLLTVARRVIVSLLKNPIIIGTLSGVAYNATGLPLDGIPRVLIDRVADIAIPCALLALGMALKRYGVRGSIMPAAAITILKVVVLPVIIFLLARYVAHMPPLYVAVATIGATCPTGVNAYLIASRIGTGHALSATVITLSTAASLVMMGFWLTVLGH
jgi:predicted permease